MADRPDIKTRRLRIQWNVDFILRSSVRVKGTHTNGGKGGVMGFT